jgi:hypothetical protein
MVHELALLRAGADETPNVEAMRSAARLVFSALKESRSRRGRDCAHRTACDCRRCYLASFLILDVAAVRRRFKSS